MINNFRNLTNEDLDKVRGGVVDPNQHPDNSDTDDAQPKKDDGCTGPIFEPFS